MKRFYDVHVFYSRTDGYSIGIEIESVKPLTENQIIEFAADSGLLQDGDESQVDYVQEISEIEYKLLKQ